MTKKPPGLAHPSHLPVQRSNIRRCSSASDCMHSRTSRPAGLSPRRRHPKSPLFAFFARRRRFPGCYRRHRLAASGHAGVHMPMPPRAALKSSAARLLGQSNFRNRS